MRPDRAEWQARAAALLPVLRANAEWGERNGRLADESVRALTDAGIFRMRVPARYGGFECDTSTLVDVSIELGRADGSAAFDVVAWWIMSWNVGLLPDEVQDEVFADPDVRICGTFAPTATAEPVDGGIVVNGSWAFNSGAAHSRWKLLSAILPTPDGPLPVMAVAPMSAMRTVEDWDVAGLKATGSLTVTARDVFVPTGWYIPIPSLLQQQYASETNAASPMYRAPMAAAVSAATCGKLVGMARGAAEEFQELIAGRPITNTDYERQADAPITHLQAGEAALKTDEAEFHARKIAAMVDDKALSGEPWSLQERAYARVAVGRVCQLASEAVELLASASGASSIFADRPIQRFRRDVQAVTIHAMNLPSTNLELYGRVLCGLEPNSFFV
jgi:alkylation response protein AidB-like acyl-CoA dehydrogenase